MIWYILYPFRGTTEPPRLSPEHPLRRAFHAHGSATARHWLLSILLTVVVTVLLCYPAIFQTDSSAAAGLRNLPKHVWTSTTELDAERAADVDVRQVWVHGDYMKAIEPRVLRQALRVQTALIGSGFDPESQAAPTQDTNTLEHEACLTSNHGRNWGFHSPLMYWNCSLQAIERDTDLLATINSRTHQHSGLNLTLRPSTVFAGKAFANKKLRAADALVITLFDQTESTLGYAWETRSRRLAQELGSGWAIFPKDGQIYRSRLYEFRFKPMTMSDDLLLGGSYLFVALYVIWRMMQLRAVKSKSGLLITICAKMIVCVIASFTVCTYLGIDLARIPRPWFPGVVFCFGLGNIFRLINVVLETPPEMPPAQRIGYALGEVGHLSLAVAGQNLVLIWLCSRLVTPWVADFCVFAAVTLVLDFVYHLTFFVAVLSVDVQRMELQDSLARSDPGPSTKKGQQERQPWLTALRQGNLPVSTRFAGSAAILSMILAVNWHFFDSDSRKLTARSIVQKFQARTRKPQETLRNVPPINQARTPAEWFKIQDHNTAREMFGFIKPDAHSFVARVYDPLLVVLEGAQGRDALPKSTSILDFARNFSHEHAFPAALIVVFLIAGVTLFMNYLLWSGLPDSSTEEKEDENTRFSVKTLPVPQALDVVRLASCSKGHLVSISLDRSTSLWLNGGGGDYSNTMLHTATLKPKLWPIVACTLDDSGRLLALAADNGQIGLWSTSARRFTAFPTIDIRGQTPVLFCFVAMNSAPEHDKLSLVVVTPDGYLTMLDARTGLHQTKRICSGSIPSATLYTCSKGDISLIYVSKPGEVYILPLKAEGSWTPEVVAGLDPGPPPGSNPSKIRSIYATPALSLIFAIRTEEVEIFDFQSRALIHGQRIWHAKPCTFRAMHSARRLCPCGAPAVRTLVLAYTEQDNDRLIMHTFSMDGASSTPRICLGKPSENGTQSCHGLQKAAQAVHSVEPAGVWESTSTLSVVGIRKHVPSSTPSSSASDDEGEGEKCMTDPSGPALAASKVGAVKEGTRRPSPSRRLLPSLDSTFSTRHVPSSTTSPSSDDSDMDDTWEAWTLSSRGEFRCRPLFSPASSSDADPSSSADYSPEAQQLFVPAPGPMARLGNKSVAVGFGNTVKIIGVGKETFFNGGCGAPGMGEDVGLDLMGMGVGVGRYKGRHHGGRRGGGAGRKMQ